MIKGGAKILLSFFLALSLAVIAWAGSTITENQKEIASLKAYKVTTKELIIRIDRKVEKLDVKLDKVLEVIK